MIVAADVPAHISRFSEMYGHAGILRNYVEATDDRLRVVGQIQHGWSVGAGLNPDPVPLYVWNDRSAAAAREGKAEAQEIVTIGAPYLYLPPGPGVQELGRVPMGLLAFPQHSTSGHPLKNGHAAWGRYAEWLADLRKQADFEQITVCLHENEYDDPSVRSILLRCGLVLATCGTARCRTTTYLDRLRGFVRQHGMATSNAIGTALIYAAFEGAPVFIDGPVFDRNPVTDTSERYYPQTSDPEWIAREFPGWRCQWNKTEPHIEDAARELGLNHKQTPWQLWSTLRLAVMP
jgi:hypothetical protein